MFTHAAPAPNMLNTEWRELRAFLANNGCTQWADLIDQTFGSLRALQVDVVRARGQTFTDPLRARLTLETVEARLNKLNYPPTHHDTGERHAQKRP